MSNVLSEAKKQQVIALGRLGWPLRRIEQETGVRRETAGAYLKAAGIAVRPPGAWGRRPAGKTGQRERGDHRIGRDRTDPTDQPQPQPQPRNPSYEGKSKSARRKTGQCGDHRVWRGVDGPRSRAPDEPIANSKAVPERSAGLGQRAAALRIQ